MAGMKSQTKGADPAAKKKRTGEVKGKIQKTTNKVEAHRKDIKEKKRKLQELSESVRNGSNPEEEAEYTSLKREVAELDGELMEWAAELETLQKEDEDISMNSDNEAELFVKPNESIPSAEKLKPPLIDLTNANGQSTGFFNSSSSDDEEALFTPAQAREATGESQEGKVVAWKQQDRSTPVIVRYGPQNAARYERSTAAKEDSDFDEDKTDQFGPDHRLGDMKHAKKFVRRRRELLGIVGLAYNCDIGDLIPKEKGDKRRVAPLEIWVKWNLGDRIEKTWEVRSSIRHLFSNAKKCDAYVFEAAKWHAARHEEWQNGQRKAENRSPTPDPNNRLSPTPGPKESEIKIESENSGNTGSSYTASSGPPNSSPMVQYREQWCELQGIDPEDMDEDATAKFLKIWAKILNSK